MGDKRVAILSHRVERSNFGQGVKFGHHWGKLGHHFLYLVYFRQVNR